MRRPGRRDMVVAAVVTVVEVLSPRTGPPADDLSAVIGTLGLLLAVAQGVPLAWRRAAPEAVLGVVTLAFVGQALLVEPVPPYGGWVALASLGVRRDARVTATATTGVVAGMLAGYLGGLGRTDEWAVPAILTVGIAVAAQLVRERRARLAAVADTAAAEERLRIARDLHDVLGHSLSGIAVQSSAGRIALDADRPEVARAALERIEEARADGATVSVRRVGALRLVPSGVCQAAYRVVQEALTNARRHAGTGPVEVEVSVVVDSDRLTLDVTDDGHGTGAGSPPQVPGHGITGICERVESLGGQLEAGSSGDTGWRVHAVLPLSGRREDDGRRR